MKERARMKTVSGIILIGWLFCSAMPLYAKGNWGIPLLGEEEGVHENSLKMQETIASLRTLIAEEPDNHEYYARLAFIFNYFGNHEEALKALKGELACYTGPEWAALYYNVALTYMKMDRFPEAKPYLDKALEHHADDISINELLMEHAIFSKDYHQAAIRMQVLSELLPERDWYHETFMKFHDEEDGEEHDFVMLYRAALAQNPDNHFAIRTNALMLRNKGEAKVLDDFDFIMSELKRAYRLNPGYVFHSVGIANTYLWKWAVDKDKGALRHAVQWMQKARRLEPENYKVLSGLGYVYLYAQQYDKAITYLTKGVALGNDVAGFRSMLAWAYNGKAYSFYKKRRNLEKGMELIEKALVYEPDNGIIMGTKAELLYALGRYEEAYEYITQALTLEPEHEEMQRDLENIKKALAERCHQR